MIVGFLICAILSLLWLPWWTVVLISFGFGFFARWGWKSAGWAAVLVAVSAAVMSGFLDYRSHFLVSQRIGPVLSAGVLPMPGALYVMFPLLMIWLVLFFARLGGSMGEGIGRDRKLKKRITKPIKKPSRKKS